MRANALFWSLGTTASTANCARSNAGASPRESVFKVDIARARRRRRRNVRFVDVVALVQVFFSFFENETSYYARRLVSYRNCIERQLKVSMSTKTAMPVDENFGTATTRVSATPAAGSWETRS